MAGKPDSINFMSTPTSTNMNPEKIIHNMPLIISGIAKMLARTGFNNGAFT